MKTTLYATLLVLLILLHACKRDEHTTAYVCVSACSVCEKANLTDVELCRSSYPTNSAYRASIDDMEAQGYTCSDNLEKQETAESLTEAQQFETSGYECEKQGGASRYTCVRNCFECEKAILSFRTCKENYTSVQDYTTAFDAYEAAGYDCTYLPSVTETANSADERNIWEDEDYNCVIE